MNISSALNSAKLELGASGVGNSWLDSLILLSYVTSFSKEQIIFNPDLKLNPKKQKIFFELVERRKKREPISHIIGKREFFGKDFLVTRDVLDPRPDSEILIEAVLQKFSDRERRLKILELGIGSGCLMITLLNAFKKAHGIGIDISDLALEIAQRNSQNHGVKSSLKLLKSDLFSVFDATNQIQMNAHQFDLIISNPPYIPSHNIEDLEPEVKLFEPRIALDGGNDGLDFYRKIAAQANYFLLSGGKIFLEIGWRQEEKVMEIFKKNDFVFISSKPDLSGVIRVLEFGIC